MYPVVDHLSSFSILHNCSHIVFYGYLIMVFGREECDFKGTRAEMLLLSFVLEF